MNALIQSALERLAELAAKAAGAGGPDAAEDAVSVPRATGTVDIVVCVYNALEDVRLCVDSVLTHLDSNSRLIIVNDCSNEATSDYLRTVVERQPRDVLLIEHPANRGYTQSVNTGLRASTADYVVLLNSDTIVTPGWAARIVACGQSDPTIGIVGPLSNAASWQNVPRLLTDEGTFSINELPVGQTPASFAALVAAASTRSYPRVSFVNGFCFAIKRDVLDEIGGFDAVSFPRGYGEENDYCIRALNAGFTLAVADDAYVYHSKSKSFGHSDRIKLSAEGKHALESKHSKERVSDLVRQVKHSKQLEAIRLQIADAIAGSRPERILFLLPVAGGGGGSHSVVQEVTAMRRLGVDARIAIPKNSLPNFLRAYQRIADHESMFIAGDGDGLIRMSADCSIVVATVFTSVNMLRRISAAHPQVVPAYYVQDYEPFFFAEGSPLYQEAIDSYTLIPGMILFAKTNWLVGEVTARHDVRVHKVSPSLDHDAYKPKAARRSGRGVVVCAMIRPKTPRRGARRTMNVLGAIQAKYEDGVSLHIFGCSDDDPGFAELSGFAQCHNHGILDREGVADVLSDADIFIDLSDYQAFGRTGLEAMACGCAVINPVRGGTDEYCVHQTNSLLVDTSDEPACVEALDRLVADAELRARIAKAGLETAARYSPTEAARSELAVLRSEVEAFDYGAGAIRVKGLVARTHIGTPTGSAFIRVLQPFEHRSVRARLLYSTTSLDEFLDRGGHRACDALLIQRDAPENLETARRLIDTCRAVGIRVVYEVDDLLLLASAVATRTNRDGGDGARLSRYLARRADAVIVTSEPLAEAYRALNRNVTVVPNALDPSLWQATTEAAPSTGTRAPTARVDATIRIGFMGTFGHGADLDLVSPALERLAKKYGDRVSFELIGGTHEPPACFQRVTLPADTSYPSFVEWFRERCNWDIGVIPLVDEDFNRAKSYIKWLEYSAVGAASVCSDVEPYRKVVRSGENGVLVSNTIDAWYEALEALIEDPKLRERLGRQALSDVRERHTLNASGVDLCRVFEGLWDQPGLRASTFPTSMPPAPVGVGRAPRRRAIRPQASPPPRAKGYALLKRRVRKLTEDPQKFLTDSRFGVVRRLGRSRLF